MGILYFAWTCFSPCKSLIASSKVTSQEMGLRFAWSGNSNRIRNRLSAPIRVNRTWLGSMRSVTLSEVVVMADSASFGALPEWQRRLIALRACPQPHGSSERESALAGSRQRVRAMSPICFHLQELLLRLGLAATRLGHWVGGRSCRDSNDALGTEATKNAAAKGSAPDPVFIGIRAEKDTDLGADCQPDRDSESPGRFQNPPAAAGAGVSGLYIGPGEDGRHIADTAHKLELFVENVFVDGDAEAAQANPREIERDVEKE